MFVSVFSNVRSINDCHCSMICCQCPSSFLIPFMSSILYRLQMLTVFTHDLLLCSIMWKSIIHCTVISCTLENFKRIFYHTANRMGAKHYCSCILHRIVLSLSKNNVLFGYFAFECYTRLYLQKPCQIIHVKWMLLPVIEMKIIRWPRIKIVWLNGVWLPTTTP